MLGVRTYEQDYVDACRRHVETAVVALQGLADAAVPAPDAASSLFNNLVIVLDAQFTHRLRGVEGKDGNPLNEVRQIAASLLTNDGRFLDDKQFKLDPAATALGLRPGDEIRVDAAGFDKLADAYFTEIEKRFT